MSDESDRRIDELDALVHSEHRGVRVLWMTGDTMQELVDRLALILGEHMTDSHELHVTYNAMQSGWHQFPPTRGMLRGPRPGDTELYFEYSAFVVLRPSAGASPMVE